VRRCNRKYLLSSDERVILHLLAYHKFHQDDTAPRAITQEGIASATNIGRNNVSKIVTSLANQGDVEIRTKHVKGLPSVRRVYALTPKGFKRALALKEEIEKTEVTVVDFNGNETNESVGNLNIFLPKSYTLLELAMGVIRGRFDCTAFHNMKIKEERRFVDYTDRKPTIRTFVGRENELKKLNDFLESSRTKVIVVYGIPGIGKTTLLAKFAQEVRNKINVFWYRLNDWVTQKIFLTPLAEFLSQMGKKGLERFISQTENPSIGEICHILETDLKDANALILIDDVHKADARIIELLRAFLGIIDHLPGIKVACTSREVPNFYTRKDVFSGLVEEIALEGLDKESSIKILKSRSIPDRYLDDLVKATKGHPLFLELVDEPSGILDKNMRMFIEQEVYSKLDLAERRILEIASVFRYPVPVDAFFIMEEEIAKESGMSSTQMRYTDYVVDHDTLDELLSKFLLQESIGRMIGMHDLLREFFYSRLTPRQKAVYHRAAARLYLRDTSPPSCIEALYHSLMADEWKTAVQIIVGFGREIVSKGYASNLAPLIDTLIAQRIDMNLHDKVELFLIYGEIREMQGEWDDALIFYNEILSFNEEVIGRHAIAETCRRIGSIYLKRAQFDQAQPFLEKGLSIALLNNDKHALSIIYYDLGGIAERKGLYRDAIELFSKAKKIAEEIGEDISLGKALYGLGRVYSQLLDYDNAIKYKKKALEVLEKTGDAREIAKVCTSLGNDYRLTEQFDRSLQMNEKAIDLATSSGDLNTIGYSLSNAAALYIETKDFVKAEETLDRAIAIFRKLDDKIMIATMNLYKGYLFAYRKNWEWAKDHFEKALESLRSLNVPLKLSHWLFEVGHVFIENGEYLQARALLNEAFQLANTHGYENLKKEIEATMDLLPENTTNDLNSESNLPA
jgi:tetratricopeptide (TPR) repeat protein